MNKIITLSILLGVTMSTVSAQSKKKEKVNSSVLVYPQINVSNIEVSAVRAEFCKGNLTFGSKSIHKKSNVCTTKNNSIKNAKAIDVFYYKVVTEEQDAYLKIVNTAGEIVYMANTQSPSKSFAKFGDGKCYWMESLVESAYKKEGAAFEKNQIKVSLANSMKNAKEFMNSALFFNYENQSFTVDYFKTKNFGYKDIEAIAEVAVKGYKLLSQNAKNEEGRMKLIEAVKVWDAALEESTPEVKKSRINRKVTIVLAENSARAKMYLMQYDDAEKTINKALTLEQNLSTTSTDRRKALLADIQRLKRAYNLNKNVEISRERLNVSLENKEAGALSTFRADYNEFVKAEGMAINEEAKEAYEEGVASGALNPYAAMVLISGVNGKLLTLPDLTAKVMGTFGGEKLDEFPLQVCELTDLTSLKLKGNNIKEIPKQIANLKSLKQLNLANNQLIKIPVEIGELTNLKTLRIIKGNNIPESEIQKIQELLPNCKIK
jgi:hypothetical protein